MEKEKVSRKFHFTQKKIEALPPNPADSKSTDQEYSDTVPGLKLFVSKNQARKSFHYRYTLNGRKRVIKIGDFNCISISEAREIAQQYRAMVSRKIDPLVERDKVQEIATLEEFSHTYLSWARSHKRSWKDDENKLKLDIIPLLGRSKLNEVTSKQVHDFLVRVKERSSGANSNRYRSLISKIYTLAIQYSVIDTPNPCRLIAKYPESGGRLRYLSEEEIKKFLDYLDEHKGNISALLLKFLLFTGLRLGETKQLKFDDINRDGTIHIRMENSKSKKARDVELNSLATAVIEELKELRVEDNPYLFKGRDPGTHIMSPKKFFYTMKEKLELSGVCIHTLRHTFSTMCITAGTDIFVLQAHLGHANIKTTSIYSHIIPSKKRDLVESVAEEINKALNL